MIFGDGRTACECTQALAITYRAPRTVAFIPTQLHSGITSIEASIANLTTERNSEQRCGTCLQLYVYKEIERIIEPTDLMVISLER